MNGDGAADICGRGTMGIVCSISEAKGTRTVRFSDYWWVNNFGDNYGWGGSLAYWGTVQPVPLPRPGFPSAAFCGRGTAGIWCSPIVPFATL